VDQIRQQFSMAHSEENTYNDMKGVMAAFRQPNCPQPSLAMAECFYDSTGLSTLSVPDGFYRLG